MISFIHWKQLLTLMPFFFGLSFRLYASELPTYHLRSDLESAFSISDGRESRFWSDTAWNHRSALTTTRERYLATGVNDGKVSISVKAVATTGWVYLVFNLNYDRKAPTSTSLNVPLDGLDIMISKYSLGQTSSSSFYMVSVRCAPEPGNIWSQIRPNSLTYDAIAAGEVAAEYIETDSMCRVIEVKISSKGLGFTPPHAGGCKAIEIRYHPSIFITHYYTSAVFATDDSLVDSDCFFMGELTMEPHFDDPIYVITSPASSAALAGGALHSITWGTTVDGGVVGLDYSVDNGGTWTAITAGTVNDGSYAWQLPLSFSDSFRVRMNSGGGVVAVSEPFSVNCPVPQLLHVPDSVTQLFFQWRGVENAASYRILIAATPSFATILIDDTVQATGYGPATFLPDAKVYWKVSSDLDFGRFSTIDSFVNIANSRVVQDRDFFTGPHATICSRGAGKIVYRIGAPVRIRIEIVGMSGRSVRVLDSGFRCPGTYEIRVDQFDRFLGNGAYLFKFSFGNHQTLIPIIRIK